MKICKNNQFGKKYTSYEYEFLKNSQSLANEFLLYTVGAIGKFKNKEKKRF